ncbi:hypothetical protein QYF36_027221 [Acer negundo]|nr:hypothetical protein QYF36_027221 [Acer negundo]
MSLIIDLATRFSGEIVNSDKIQAYKGLDIATNKATEAKHRGVPHYLLGFLEDPEEDFTIQDFCHHALMAINQIIANGHIQIVIRGSNTYIEALIEDLSIKFRANFDCLFCIDSTGEDFNGTDKDREDFDGNCTTPATRPTVVVNHGLRKAMLLDMFVEFTKTVYERDIGVVDQNRLQNVDDLYPALGALDNMPDEYEDERTTDNLTAPRSKPTSAAGPSRTATPTPTTGVANVPTPPRRCFRAGTVGGTGPCSTTISASRYCPRGTTWSFYLSI